MSSSKPNNTETDIVNDILSKADTNQLKLEDLSKLPLLEYDQCRIAEAEMLGIRPATLDKLLIKLRNQSNKGNETKKTDKQFEKQMFGEVTPSDSPVDGAALLDGIVSTIETHLVCEKSTAQAVALWVLFTWVIDAMKISPILYISAAQKRCGKTQLLTIVLLLAQKTLPASNITTGALFRAIDAYSPTLVLDEADTFLTQNDEMRGIINSGHSKELAYVIRTVGDDYSPQKFKTWCAKAIAGIGNLNSTIADRSIIINLKRKKKTEIRKSIRHVDHEYFNKFRSQLARWSNDNIDSLRSSIPNMPKTLNDRASDNWESLVIIADQIGDHWPRTARHIALAISGADQEEPTPHEELLADIKNVFETEQVEKMLTTVLLGHLNQITESQWATLNRGHPMSSRQLAQMLRTFKIYSKDMRTALYRGKGYEKQDFTDSFERYVCSENHSS